MTDRIQRLGRITTWKDEQGFGFLTPKGGGNEVFVHVKAFSNRQRRPKTADIVTYELTTDAKGRLRAARVAFFGDEALPEIRGGGKALALPAIFFLILIADILMRRLPFQILAVYAVASAVTFVVYARDKSAAQRNTRRTPEDALHALSLIGGWPGAVVAQELLRHKSMKQSFRNVFWITVILNCLGVAWLFTRAGQDALRSIVGSF